MKDKKFLWLIIGLTVLALSLAACGASASDKANFPTGKFINPNDENGGGMQFNADGTWTAFNKAYILAKGTYSVDGDTYIEESNNGGCSAPISFKFTFDGTNLTFKYAGNPADDSCDGRRAGFDNVTYTLSK